ncbi:DUF2442 domain-containing protein [Mucilaginibacter sp. UR6-11]|uniref:DUF2442 domain-containing protein n=1 Tax=Mucilaginibacter sp. UR6-11 TaxID=1435644 RepID=UPI001E43422B|nr:DUF2442 domain-containing protein [Mucilaginibacter sp. UR6-11]MCC8425066.1 DUF2442 domain-containing protein [Mucilaginibacter sp. UR6-11]
MPLFTTRKQEKKVKVTFNQGLLIVEKANGKQDVFMLEWFPKLQNATDEEREDWVQTDKGIRFTKLDLDISIT